MVFSITEQILTKKIFETKHRDYTCLFWSPEELDATSRGAESTGLYPFFLPKAQSVLPFALCFLRLTIWAFSFHTYTPTE